MSGTGCLDLDFNFGDLCFDFGDLAPSLGDRLVWGTVTGRASSLLTLTAKRSRSDKTISKILPCMNMSSKYMKTIITKYKTNKTCWNKALYLIACIITKNFKGYRIHLVDFLPFLTRDNFCEIAVCFPVHKPPSEKGSTLKERICSLWEQILSF